MLLETSEKWKLRDQDAPPPRKELPLLWMTMMIVMMHREDKETHGGQTEGRKRSWRQREGTSKKA
jgi:hypothetical protein